jgi:transposase
MASLIKKTIKGHDYYYVVESARVNGKPRIVSQIYLGSLEAMVEAHEFKKRAGEQNPDHSVVLEFGAVSALLDIAERLGVRDIIDKHAGKRRQGLAVGDQIVLAAINRAVEPVSKSAFFEDWFERTILPKFFPAANRKNLSSQGFWNNMSVLDADKIRAIEEELTAKIVQLYNIPINCLLYDNTNFYTYIDTDNQSKLVKRGKSKEHRSDLKIIGLSLLVSGYHNIPLFHEVYPGNMNDAKHFSETINKLKDRYLKIGYKEETITIIFDRGNNSAANIESLLNEDICKFYFVGGLKQNQGYDLLDEAYNNYSFLNNDIFKETTAYRTSKEEFGIPVTVVVTHNTELYNKQLRGIIGNIEKCKIDLNNLITKLLLRANGTITKGRNYTIESITKKVTEILHAEHMKQIFDYNITTINNIFFDLKYQINEDKFDLLKSKFLGKSILFTNRHNWSTEDIISAYRSQFHVEECFKQLKNSCFLSFRPIRHFTDNKIRVHAFYCVIALLLCSVLNIEIEKIGYKISIKKMLRYFSDTQQVISVYNIINKPVKQYSFSRLEGISKEYNNIYNIAKYSYK